MNGLQRVKLMRSAHCGQMSKLCTKADAIVSKDDITQNDTDLLTCTIEGITEKLELLKTLDEIIISEVEEDEECGILIIEADDYAATIAEHLAKYKSTLRRITEPKTVISTPFVPSASAETPTTRPKKVNLPKLSPTRFHGDILQWQSFIDSFQAAVDSDTLLDNIQKFQYLKAQLSGDAEKVIEGLALTNGNYTEAMKLLQDRYGQPHKVRSALMIALWELPKPSEELVSLRTFFDRMQEYIRGLDALGKSEESSEDLLVCIIQEKLPGNVRKLIARGHGNREGTLADLRRCISEELDAMEAGDVDLFASDSHREYSPPPTTQAFLTHAAKPSNTTKPRPTTCAFCKGPHFSAECTKVTSIEKRMDIVKRDYLCYNCLGSHKIRNCKSSKRCRECNRKHHTALCRPNKDVRPTTSASNRVVGNQEPALYVRSPFTVEATSNNIGSVLLKTAVADVTSGPRHTSATILFDEGASRSFITQELARKLDLQPTGQISLQIAAFGNNQDQRTFDFTKITLKTKFGSPGEITALIVPTITAPIRNCVTTQTLQLPHLIGLTLAHPASAQTHLHISILIGADFYWSFVGDHVIRGNGPTAVESKLGYLLSGPLSRDCIFPNEITAFHVLADVAQPDPRERFWNLETIGIMDTQPEDNSRHDFENFRDQHIERRQDHYVDKLPWKADHAPLPTNHHISQTRTRRMVQRLPLDTLPVYDRVINDQETRPKSSARKLAAVACRSQGQSA